MKKIGILLAFLSAITTGITQKVDMHLFELNDLRFSRPTILGKVGTHYMVYDEAKGWPALLYTFDSSFRLSNTTEQFINSKRIQFKASDTYLYLIWQSQVRDSLIFSAHRINEQGNLDLFIRNSYFFPGYSHAEAPSLVTDIRNNYFLLYALETDPAKGTYLRTVLLDSASNERRSGIYPVPIDRTFQSMSPPMIDASGNIHFAVYDKLSSYHISTTLTAYTIPIQKDSLISISTQIDKRKFFGFNYYDDTATQQVKLLGYYYDGHDKIKKGITSLYIPYSGSGQKIREQYYPFPPELSGILHNSIRHARKKDDPADYLAIRDIYERNDRIFVGNWLMDMPNYTLRKDGDIGKEMPPQKTKSRAPQHPGLNSQRSFHSHDPGPIVRIGTENLLSRLIGWPFGNNGTSYLGQNCIYFSIDKTGAYEYALLTDRSLQPFSEDLLDYPLAYPGGLLFLSNEAVSLTTNKTKTTELRLSFARYENVSTRTNVKEFDSKSSIFYSPVTIGDGKYMGLYYNLTDRQFGMAAWFIKPTP
jgi:hypothetical protein